MSEKKITATRKAVNKQAELVGEEILGPLRSLIAYSFGVGANYIPTDEVSDTVSDVLENNEWGKQVIHFLAKSKEKTDALESQLSLYKQKCELMENVIRAAAQYKISKSVVIKINLTKATEALSTFNEQHKEIK